VVNEVVICELCVLLKPNVRKLGPLHKARNNRRHSTVSRGPTVQSCVLDGGER